MLIVEPDLIRSHRETHRRSLRWLAKRVGCSHTQIAKYENGITKEIREDWADTISLVLEMPFSRAFKPRSDFSVSKLSTGLDASEQSVA